MILPKVQRMSENMGIVQKNQEFTGMVESLGSNGEGIVHIGETVYFAPFTVVGEKIKFKALKVKISVMQRRWKYSRLRTSECVRVALYLQNAEDARYNICVIMHSSN